MPSRVLPRRFYARSSMELAPDLLGQRLVRVLPDGTRLAGLIVEVEAYCGPIDAASHAYKGRRTPRNEAMYGRPGTAYVYFTYGMHFCVNVVCSRVGDPQAVLIRALEPTEGLDLMRAARPKARTDTDLCSGPGKLCQALRIDMAFNEADLTGISPLFIERSRRGPLDDKHFFMTPRIGVGYAGVWVSRDLRWCLRGCPHVSGPRRLADGRVKARPVLEDPRG